MDIAASIAVSRFGLGPGRSTPEQARRDPRRWVRDQIARSRVPPELSEFPGSAQILKDLFQARASGVDMKAEVRKQYRQSFVREVAALASVRVHTSIPFHERMVMFWSNHFTVSRTRAVLGPAIPAYERDAIRPHVFGRFEDMLQAVCSHAVMVGYLDNTVSVGAGSVAGRRSGRTLNENLAREILELHTLGVNGGYTQDDVREFAKVLTGWTHGGIVPKRSSLPIEGAFVFRDRVHEPGPKTVLGKTYPEAGVEEGRAVLSDLARHPSTARFIATKLVRHFVADEPPVADVERIAAVFRDSDGDLAKVSAALIQLESVWATPLAKVKTPYELVISALRVLDIRRVTPSLLRVPLRTMGQDPYRAPSPQGWPDTASHWLSPQALMRRIEWVRAVSARSSVPPDRLLEAFEPVATDALRTWMARAPSADAANALLLASPMFQRR